MSVKELADEVDMSTSRTHRYLASLVRAGLIERDAASGRYDLGELTLQLGVAALNRLNPVAEASKTLRTLVNDVDQTAVLAVWSERGPVIAHWIHSSRPVIMNLNVGSILPILTSSSARVFLAFMPPNVLEATLDSALRALEPQAAKEFDMEKLRRQIAEVQRDHLARVAGAVAPGLLTASAPVLDAQGEPVAAMSLVATHTTDMERFEAAIPVLCRGAGQVSRRLGYRPRQPDEPSAS
uniref:Putative transcriptional regulatory protein OhbR n=1 Tax=Pseudomonas aeruginosa TaxID=287 RepID=Q9Z5W3_PSEAI|nr:putative transcriptional regulatory protein OhbR [Pseudomonas aeruginosa]